MSIGEGFLFHNFCVNRKRRGLGSGLAGSISLGLLGLIRVKSVKNPLECMPNVSWICGASAWKMERTRTAIIVFWMNLKIDGRRKKCWNLMKTLQKTKRKKQGKSIRKIIGNGCIGLTVFPWDFRQNSFWESVGNRKDGIGWKKFIVIGLSATTQMENILTIERKNLLSPLCFRILFKRKISLKRYFLKKRKIDFI